MLRCITVLTYLPALSSDVLQEKQEIKSALGQHKVGQFQIANLQATHSLTNHSTDPCPPPPDSDLFENQLVLNLANHTPALFTISRVLLAS